MPLDRETRSALRDRVSLANRSTVAAVIADVERARDALPVDDKDHERLGMWLEDLGAIASGGVIGRS